MTDKKHESIETTIDLTPDKPQQNAGLPEPKDIAGADDAIQIEVVDDTPPEDRKKAAKEKAKPESEEDELAGYSEKVQKRIKQLKYEFHEERRAKEASNREREEAVRVLQLAFNDKVRLEKILETGSKTLKDSEVKRLESQIEQAKREYRAAYEEASAEKMADAQEKIAKFAAEKERVSYAAGYTAPEQPVQRQAPQQAQVPKPTEKDLDWQSQNNWFGKDKEMTGYVYGVHERLVTEENIRPGTDEYYKRIDDTMRKRFPEKFDEDDDDRAEETRTAQPRRAAVVAPVRRSAPNGNPRKVQLTVSQVAIAKRLGITPEQYAAQLLKDTSNGQ